MAKKISYLSGEDIFSIHNEVAKIFADSGDPIIPAGAKYENLVHSAATRPLTSFGSTEKYRTVSLKAAALFHSLCTNHAFHNGNKRTALVSLLIFLHQNDYRFTIDDDLLYDFVLSVADNSIQSQTRSGHPDEIVDVIATWIHAHSTRIDHVAKSMRIDDFIAKCELAGATSREAARGGSWIIQGAEKMKSIRINKSTREIDGQVVKKYLRDLGMSTGLKNFTVDEFIEGVKPEQELMRRYRTVLERLAAT